MLLPEASHSRHGGVLHSMSPLSTTLKRKQKLEWTRGHHLAKAVYSSSVRISTTTQFSLSSNSLVDETACEGEGAGGVDRCGLPLMVMYAKRCASSSRCETPAARKAANVAGSGPIPTTPPCDKVAAAAAAAGGDAASPERLVVVVDASSWDVSPYRYASKWGGRTGSRCP